MQHDEVDQLAQRHGAWRLLRSPNAALILSFLGTHLLEANRGGVSQSELVGLLDEHLYAVHRIEPDRYPREPVEYLEAWSSSDDGWLRRFYPSRSDEIHYEATATLEKAFRWVEQLRERTFIGTESRLHTLVSLLREIVHGSAEDPQVRIDELSRRRDEIDAEIDRIRSGDSTALDAVEVRDRFQLFTSMSRELLGDFREVEENFRRLDRSAREKIAAWEGGKGELLADLIADRADISTSEQGRSFQAFYDFLLSDEQQDELAALLADLQQMPTIEADRRIRMLHHDWAEAAERTQATVRTLSEQLRRFLDDRVWFEHRRVLDLARAIEAAALSVRAVPPRDDQIGLCVDEPGLSIVMPFERPLYQVRPESAVNSLVAPAEVEDTDLGALFAQRHINLEHLAENIRAIVPPRSTAALSDIVEMYPPEDGAAEIIAYLTLDSRDDLAVHTDESDRMAIPYTGADGIERRMILPRVTIERL